MPSLKYTYLKNICKNSNSNFNIDNMIFYESGTYYGSTTLEMQPHFEYVITTEVSNNIFNNTHKHLSKFNNILHYNSPSEKLLPDIISKFINKQFIFFLDGHYSSGDTDFSNVHVPLLDELKHINQYYINDGIIIIDDYNLFETNNNEDWSNITIDNVINCFTHNQIYTYYILNSQMIIVINNST